MAAKAGETSAVSGDGEFHAARARRVPTDLGQRYRGAAHLAAPMKDVP